MRVVTCAAGAADLDFLVIDDFLESEACDRLAKVYRESDGHYETWHKDPFWKGRLLSHRDVKNSFAQNSMRRIIRDARLNVRAFYPSPPLYTDVLHIVGWPQGMKMPSHADNAHENGDIHEFHWRDYSGVLYLNDDFTGGGLHLPKQDILIQPRKGMFVSLPCGLSHMHGVTEITLGTRITMAFFLTRDAAHADPDLLERVVA